MDIVPKKKWRYPLEIEREYAKYLVAYVGKEMEIVESFIPEMADAVYRNGIHTDGIGDWLGNLVDKVQRKVKEKLSAVPVIGKIFKRVNSHVNQQMTEITDSVFGARPRQFNTRQLEMTKTIWSSQNLTLIKSIDQQIMDKVRFALSQRIIRTVDKEKTVAELTQEIQNITGAAQKRATLIAVDQVGKLHSQLTQYRQMKAGIERYIWVTMLDNRVRDTHRKRHGVSYRWDRPPDDGHPGWPIRCRCVAQPMYNLDSFRLTPKPNSFTYEQRSVTIRSKLEYVMESTGLNGELIYPPPAIDYNNFKVDLHHMNQESKHGVSVQEAREFVANAKFAIRRDEAKSVNFFSDNGASYVQVTRGLIRTAFKRREFDPRFAKMLEVLRDGS